jgi:tRNA (cytidine/uridine-2'-O-)-methyltransferase
MADSKFFDPPNIVIALVEPQIPSNTGNITRLCACTGVPLYLIGQLGFRLDDKLLDRAAMDYKEMVEPIHLWSFQALLDKYPEHQPFFLSSKAEKSHFETHYPEKSILVFGSETKGLPTSFVQNHLEQAIRIPMVVEGRSLNLSNAVSIVLYEAIRQQQLV